jgi:hypothetical protein
MSKHSIYGLIDIISIMTKIVDIKPKITIPFHKTQNTKYWPWYIQFRTQKSTEEKNKHTPWPESGSELYKANDRHLSAKLVPTFADKST